MTRGLSFGPAADLYDQIRPTYPARALEWALGTAPKRVLDLGAGTGILSRVLLALGHEVVAVEPDEGMRAKLRRTTPGVTALDGRAEVIPLSDEDVDAVVAGQAYHWFDPEPAHREIARVIKSGGVFAPIWNVRDHDVPWIRQLTAIVEDLHDHDGGVHNGEVDQNFGPEFGPVQREMFRHEVSMTADRLVQLVSSRSYYLTAPPEKQAAIKTAVRQLAATLPETFALPYVTVAYRATRCARR
jgi:SAM-dependent methyltransferase